MKNRIPILDTDLSVYPIGLGTVSAGSVWEEAAAERIFDAFLDGGGNVIDTARIYSAGRSEAVIGSWFQKSGKRSQVVLVTKGGHPKFDSPKDDLHISRMTDADMREDIVKSLRALKTDYIDLYFYHRDDRRQSVEEEIETMENFRRGGKIRYYGCSNWDTDRIVEADRYCKKMGYRGFVADQALLNFGMKYMKPLPDDTLVYLRGDLWEYHVRNERNLAMPYMGVASGFFHKYAVGGREAVEKSPYCTPGNLKVADRCMELCQTYCATVTQVLLGYFLAQPFACAPLYGPKNADQIIEALQTTQFAFSSEDFAVSLEWPGGTK